jgi:hypothetical protein
MHSPFGTLGLMMITPLPGRTARNFALVLPPLDAPRRLRASAAGSRVSDGSSISPAAIRLTWTAFGDHIGGAFLTFGSIGDDYREAGVVWTLGTYWPARMRAHPAKARPIAVNANTTITSTTRQRLDLERMVPRVRHSCDARATM